MQKNWSYQSSRPLWPLWQKKLGITRLTKDTDPNDPTPLETENVEMTPKLREIADVREPIDSFDYSY